MKNKKRINNIKHILNHASLLSAEAGIMVQEEDLLIAQEEDLLIVQEEDLLIVQKEDLLLVGVRGSRGRDISSLGAMGLGLGRFPALFAWRRVRVLRFF